MPQAQQQREQPHIVAFKKIRAEKCAKLALELKRQREIGSVRA